MSVDHLLTHWQTVRTGLLETIDKFQDADLEYRPFPAGWTVRQLLLHIAHEEYGEFSYGISQQLIDFPPEFSLEDGHSLAAVKQKLAEVHQPVLDYVRALSDGDLIQTITTPWGPAYPLLDMLEHIIDHEIHHRAELSFILGLLGREGLNA